MIYLKTKAREPREFAILKEPATPTHNDEELYEAVRKHGKAVIRCYPAAGLLGEPIDLTPEEFEQKWMGD